MSTSPAVSGSSSPRSPSSQSYSFPVRHSPAQSSPTGGHDSGISCDASLASSPIMGRPFSPSQVRIARRRFPVLLCHSPSLPSIQSSSSLSELEAGFGDSDNRYKDHAGDNQVSEDQVHDGVARRRISLPLDTRTQAYQEYYQRSECQASRQQATTCSRSGTSGNGSVLHHRTTSLLLIPSSSNTTPVLGSDCNKVLKREFEGSGVAKRLSNLFPAEAERLSRSQSSFVLNLSKNPSGSSDATLRSVMDRVRVFESFPKHRSMSRDEDREEDMGNKRSFPQSMKSVSVTGTDSQSLPLFNKLSGRDLSLATVGPDCYVSSQSLAGHTITGSRGYEERNPLTSTPAAAVAGDRSHLLSAAAKSRRLILPRILTIEKALKRKPDRFLLSSQSRRGHDPVTELEDLVLGLGLDDEDLLDRAERRDLPTRLQLLRPSAHSHVGAKIDPSLTGDKDQDLLSFERLKTPADVRRGPRAPPVRRSAIPDLIHDDVAFRKLRSKNRNRRATDAKSLPASCSSSYMLCSPIFTPCHIVLPPTGRSAVSLEPEPNVELDDVSYRRVMQSQGAKVSQPDPPFGIPKRVLLHSASCDYLHALVDREDKELFRRKASKRGDRVKDDLAIRSWRRDLDQESDRESPPLLPVTTRNVLLMKQGLRPCKSHSSLSSSSLLTTPCDSSSLLSSIPPPPLIDMQRNRSRIQRLFQPGNRFPSHRPIGPDEEISSPPVLVPFNAMTGHNRASSDASHDVNDDCFHLISGSRPSDPLVSHNWPQSILIPDHNQTGTAVTCSPYPYNRIHGQANDARRLGYCKVGTKEATKVRGVTRGSPDDNKQKERMEEMFAGIIADMRKREIFGRRDSIRESPGFRRESLF